MDRLFTPREVDALIPKIEEAFQHMEACRKRAYELAATRPAAALRPSAAEIAESARIRSQVQFLLQAVQQDIDLVGQWGGIVKDVEAGLVDFLGLVEGEEVWLCWKRGEPRVQFWHALDAGYSGCRPLRRSEYRSGTTH